MKTVPLIFKTKLITLFRTPQRVASEDLEQRVQICLKILSLEDRFTRIRNRCQDYFHLGVPEAWVFNPAERLAHVLRPDSTMTTQREGSLQLAGTPISVSLVEIFSALDQA